MTRWEKWVAHYLRCKQCELAADGKNSDTSKLCLVGQRLYAKIPETEKARQRRLQGIEQSN